MSSFKMSVIGIYKKNLFSRTWILFFLATFLVIFHNPSMASCATGSITSAETACSFSSGSLSISSSGSIAVTGATVGLTIPDSSSVTAISNDGTISSVSGRAVSSGNGTIGSLTNIGTITSSANNAIYNTSGTINNLTNSSTGTISGGFGGIVSTGTLGTLNNAGLIRSTGSSSAIYIGGDTTNIINTSTGTISNTGSSQAIYNLTGKTIQSIDNAGTIQTTSGYTLRNDGTIVSLVNSGTITKNSGSNDAIYNTGTITTLTNTSSGTIGNAGTGAGIRNNAGTITTFNNAQGAGNSSGAVVYVGALPTNYNIIINGSSSYGQLSGSTVTGSTAFGVYTGSTITTKLYTGVLQGLTTSNVGATRTGTYGNFSWTLALESGSSTIWDLIFTGASTADTQQSLVNTSQALQNTFALQNTVLANSFLYDCNDFGASNVCISAGGRNTAISAAGGLNNTSALLIAAYRLMPSIRVGGYADQNLSVNNSGSTVSLGNNTPLVGLFGVWNHRLDGTGTELKVSAAYGQKNMTVNRQIVGTSEAGSGSSQLNSQGAQVTAKYGFGIADKVIVSPYVGIRYTQNNMGGYTEGTSANVTIPLTYSALNTNATTALAGVGASYNLTPQTTVFASAGVETDTNTANGSYSAAGVTGLTPVNFNANPVKTRPTAVLGAYYEVEKNQRIGVTGVYRQESYQAVSTTSVLATYTVGL